MNVTRASITILIDDAEGVVWLAKDKTKILYYKSNVGSIEHKIKFCAFKPPACKKQT